MGPMLRIALFFLRIGMFFVPQEKYQEKVAAIPGMTEKHEEFNLDGWEYRSIRGREGIVHRYYYFPAQREDAPTMLCFHGLNLDGRTFMNLTACADRFHIVAYDLPEQSPRYRGEFDDFMFYVNDFIDSLKTTNCGVMGVSFGGSIALRLAARHSVLTVSHLVLASTTIVGDSPKQRDRNQEMARWVSHQPDYKLYWFMEKLIERSRRSFVDDTAAAVSGILRIKHPDFYRQVGRAMGSYSAVEDARAVTCPTLVLMGTKDNLFSEEQAISIKKYIPHADYQTVPGGTHAMVYTRGEEIARRICRFCGSSGHAEK